MSDWFPKNISTFGGDIDSVFYLIFYIVGIGFLLGEGAIIYFLIRYRRRAGKKAIFVRGESWSQVAWILVPGLIVMLLDFWIDFAGAKAYEHVKGEMPASEVVVQVTGKQFNWIITYPGPDGIFGTSDDFTQENDLHVPVNKVVQVVLKSEDVIHSFFVPVLRLKQDTVPGREILAWFEATETGKYEMPCAELCGYGHYTMRGFLHVHSEDEYAEWVEEHWPSP
ncbi:MAG: cytochrome c oxidase subunit II [bacterium]